MKRALGCRLLVFSLIAFCTGLKAQSNESTSVSICDDEAEWPPFTYFERKNGRKTGKITGFMVDVADEVFKKHKVVYSITMLPWKRCQAEVAKGRNFQMLLSLSYNEKRAKRFLFSDAVYLTVPHYFYSKKQFPDGLQISSPEDLNQRRVCGLLGYNYGIYGIDYVKVETGNRTYADLITLLHSQRCDLFIEQLEVIAGFASTGTPLLSDPELAFAPLPYVQPTAFHVAFSRNAKGESLKQMMDLGIAEMRASGRLQELLKQYLP